MIIDPVVERSRGLSGRTALSSLHPGHRPSASALGWDLPARWAEQAGHSRPANERRPMGAPRQICCDAPLALLAAQTPHATPARLLPRGEDEVSPQEAGHLRAERRRPWTRR